MYRFQISIVLLLIICCEFVVFILVHFVWSSWHLYNILYNDVNTIIIIPKRFAAYLNNLQNRFCCVSCIEILLLEIAVDAIRLVSNLAAR